MIVWWIRKTKYSSRKRLIKNNQQCAQELFLQDSCVAAGTWSGGQSFLSGGPFPFLPIYYQNQQHQWGRHKEGGRGALSLRKEQICRSLCKGVGKTMISKTRVGKRGGETACKETRGRSPVCLEVPCAQLSESLLRHGNSRSPKPHPTPLRCEAQRRSTSHHICQHPRGEAHK